MLSQEEGELGGDVAKTTAGEFARDIGHKFELYTIALTFTILGAAIQTAKVGGGWVADGFELLGWALLLVSGLVALRRFQFVSGAYKLVHEIEVREQTRIEVAKLPPQQPIPTTSQGVQLAGDVVGKITTALTKGEGMLRREERRLMRLFRAHMWLLFAGLVCLGTARATGPAERVAEGASAFWRARLSAQKSEAPSDKPAAPISPRAPHPNSEPGGGK